MTEGADCLLVAGTASHVGKSTVVAGLCRALTDRGVSVAPYKAQNMSNNARAVPKPERDEFGEIGVSQYVQAKAARIEPTTDLNPVLLKPRGEGESQLVVQGEAVGHYEAGSYYEDHWENARVAAKESYDRLAAEHDVIVAEGAGSIAEINLHDRDLANVETARFSESVARARRDEGREAADTRIVLVADIERGGVFASIVGTLELVPDDIRERIVGVVINKFRGDASLLDPGIEEVEERTGVPILGVLPYNDPGLPAEDSLSLPGVGERAVHGAADGVPDEQAVTIAVPRLPHISNFTDLDPLAAEPGVRIAYVPLDAELADADAVVIPGTKNTVDDCLALRTAGLDARLRAFDGPIVGLCGGYQILGERITNAQIEGTGGESAVQGVGLLPVETAFSTEKTVERVTRTIDGVGPLAGAHGTVEGYEIHMGDTQPVDRTVDVDRPFSGPDEGSATGVGGAATDRVLGTYLHGLFENQVARDAFVDAAFTGADIDRPEPVDDRGSPYDRAASLIIQGLSIVEFFPNTKGL